MTIDTNDEIVQDFLVEAGEILAGLANQLIELEGRGDDAALLNSIFRGFHTIKGGAGFLGIEHLVDVSHKAEDIFDLLRRGARRMDSALMDVVLQVLDVMNAMFGELHAGSTPGPAPAALLAALAAQASPVERAGSKADSVTVAPAAPSAAGEEITDAEFERVLDELHGPGKARGVAAASAGDDFTEAEFEKLLDELHGPGKTPRDTSMPAAPVAKAVERTAGKPTAAPAGDATVRVEVAVLDRIMNMVGELVLIRNRLTTLGAEIGNEHVSRTVSALDVVTSDLQAAAIRTRMQPIKKVFGRFPRVVRDLARSLDKEVNLVLTGEDTDLDKNLLEALSDSLVHLVRNAVDHGIETPARRLAAGKPRAGTMHLSAEQEGDRILLQIRDDGAGMDPEVLRAKAVEKGLMDADAAARLTDGECFDLIFLPGFSTKTEISDVSGRGVGMDVVKTRIAQLSGSVVIDSRLGLGTTISIHLPLTLAILPTLMIVVGTQVFALPLLSVKEILDVELDKASVIDGQQVIVVRGRPLPIFYLGRSLARSGGAHSGARGHIVIVKIGSQSVGLLVDALLGREEVVIKPLGAMLQGTRGLAGATITGDGKIALILDLPSLLGASARRG